MTKELLAKKQLKCSTFHFMYMLKEVTVTGSNWVANIRGKLKNE